MANNNNPIDGSKEEDPSKEKAKVQPKAENAGINEKLNKVQDKEKSEGQLPQAKAEGQPAPKEQEVSTGKGPKPVGPNQQTWDNPKPGEELKKEIDEQLTKLKKLGENPSAHDPEIDELSKKQDIESRNEGPEHDKKSEKNTQDNFDPAKHKTEAPTH